MSAVKVTWTHAALAVADRHGFELEDRHWAELHAQGGQKKPAEVVVEAADAEFVVFNRQTLRRKI